MEIKKIKTEEIRKEDKYLNNIIKRVLSNFVNKVENESNSANVLLKGHLLSESVLEECLAVFDIKEIRITKLSFHEKVKYLSEIRTNNKKLEEVILYVVPALFSLNDVRNNLAHDLGFEVSDVDINRIGINLGSSYISKKYELGHEKIREILLFILEQIFRKLSMILFLKLKEEK